MLAKTPAEKKVMLIRESVTESFLIDGGTMVASLIVIYVSWLFNSQAMGWFGLFFILAGIIPAWSMKGDTYTIAEARDKLDEIEKSL
jgi:hypothetical protein